MNTVEPVIVSPWVADPPARLTDQQRLMLSNGPRPAPAVGWTFTPDGALRSWRGSLPAFPVPGDVDLPAPLDQFYLLPARKGEYPQPSDGWEWIDDRALDATLKREPVWSRRLCHITGRVLVTVRQTFDGAVLRNCRPEMRFYWDRRHYHQHYGDDWYSLPMLLRLQRDLNDAYRLMVDVSALAGGPEPAAAV